MSEELQHAICWPPKDPQERLPYSINWTKRNLGNAVIEVDDIIATVVAGSCTIDNSVVAEDGFIENAKSGQVTTHWISGGTIGDLCEINVQVTTDEGHIVEQTVYLPIEKK